MIKGLCSIFTLGKVRAYRSISFEQEAYGNEDDLNYLENRKKFN